MWLKIKELGVTQVLSFSLWFHLPFAAFWYIHFSNIQFVEPIPHVFTASFEWTDMKPTPGVLGGPMLRHAFSRGEAWPSHRPDPGPAPREESGREVEDLQRLSWGKPVLVANKASLEFGPFFLAIVVANKTSSEFGPVFGSVVFGVWACWSLGLFLLGRPTQEVSFPNRLSRRLGSRRPQGSASASCRGFFLLQRRGRFGCFLCALWWCSGRSVARFMRSAP